MKNALLILWLICSISPHSSRGEEIDKGINFEDMSMTPTERSYFNRFKAEVVNILTEDYMHKEMYLAKWLKEWRKEYNMSQILNEDFSDFERQFPITIDAKDKIGRPVGTADIGDWDIRAVVLSGKKDKGIRFVFRMAEIGVQRVMEAHEKNPNVTSGIIILNVDGFNMKMHGCGECIPICKNLIVSLESYFPFMVFRFFVINTPMSMYPVAKTFAPFMKKHVRNVLKVYGVDKSRWQAAILQLINPEEIETQFGGTRKRHD